MSRRLGPPVLAFVLFVPAAFSTPAPEDVTAKLRKADQVRGAWNEALLKLRVTTSKPGAPPSSKLIEVWVKGNDRARIVFADPKDAGKLVVSKGDESWLVLPGTKNPIRIPRRHRVTGGFAAADVSKIRFAEEYDGVVEREDVLDGRPCEVLRLAAKAGRKPSFPVVRLWIDRKEGLYRKVVFLVASGKTAKETTFDAYRTYRGILSVERMTIVDALKPGTTVVEYLDYEKRPVSDDLFVTTPAPVTTSPLSR